MKKMILFLLAVTIVTATLAQTGKPYISEGKDPIILSKSYSCPDGSVFSQVPSVVDNGYYCQGGYDFYLVATNYSATGPFTNFRLWGGDFHGCTLDATEEFEVIIWDGDPSVGGNIIFQETLNGATTDIGEAAFGTAIYQIDIDLGTVINQTSGYIGVTRNNPSGCTGFAWIADDNGSNNKLSYNGTSWLPEASDLFFCLSYEEPAAVPISNWVTYLTALLIGVFFFFRIRKII